LIVKGGLPPSLHQPRLAGPWELLSGPTAHLLLHTARLHHDWFRSRPWGNTYYALNQPAAIRKVAPNGAVSTVFTLNDPPTIAIPACGPCSSSVPSFGPFLAADSANNVIALPYDTDGYTTYPFVKLDRNLNVSTLPTPAGVSNFGASWSRLTGIALGSKNLVLITHGMDSNAGADSWARKMADNIYHKVLATVHEDTSEVVRENWSDHDATLAHSTSASWEVATFDWSDGANTWFGAVADNAKRIWRGIGSENTE